MPELRHLDDETLALLALGALDPAEAEPAEQHLAACAPCRERLGERLGETALLAEAVEPAEPSPEIRARLLARVAEEPQGHPAAAVPQPGSTSGSAPGPAPGPATAPAGTAPTPFPPPTARPAGTGGTPRAPRRPSLPWLALAASLVVGALLGGWATRAYLAGDADPASVEAAHLEEELAAARREIGRLERDLGSARNLIALTAAREAVALAGLESAAQAHGRVFIDRAGGRALFVAGDLPPLPRERVYQLWRIVDGQPLPAGLLDPRQAEGVLVESLDGAGGETWAVTVEPEGGVPAPTGRMVLSS